MPNGLVPDEGHFGRESKDLDRARNLFAPSLERVFDAERYPLAARVGMAADEHYQGAYDPEYAFGFGLQRLLDANETFVDEASRR
jgi:hypothetical protein